MILLIILAPGSVRTIAQPRVLFRIDDFGIDNEEFYPKLFEIFKSHSAKLLMGIVPFKEKNGKTDSLSKRQINIIRSGIELGVVEIAQQHFLSNASRLSKHYD